MVQTQGYYYKVKQYMKTLERNPDDVQSFWHDEIFDTGNLEERGAFVSRPDDVTLQILLLFNGVTENELLQATNSKFR